MKKAQIKKLERAAYKAGILDKDGYFIQSDADFWRDIRGPTERDRKELKRDLKELNLLNGRIDW